MKTKQSEVSAGFSRNFINNNVAKIRIPLILLMGGLILAACSGSGGGSAGSSGGSTSTGLATVNCASGSLCPPAQVNAVNPKVN